MSERPLTSEHRGELFCAKVGSQLLAKTFKDKKRIKSLVSKFAWSVFDCQTGKFKLRRLACELGLLLQLILNFAGSVVCLLFRKNFWTNPHETKPNECGDCQPVAEALVDGHFRIGIDAVDTEAFDSRLFAEVLDFSNAAI